MPRGQHVGCDSNGLHAERIRVYLALGEVRRLVFEPDEEVVLDGVGFEGGADRRPEY